MRKNHKAYYKEFREIVFDRLLDYAKRNNFKLIGNRKNDINIIFRDYGNNFKVDLERITLNYFKKFSH